MAFGDFGSFISDLFGGGADVVPQAATDFLAQGGASQFPSVAGDIGAGAAAAAPDLSSFASALPSLAGGVDLSAFGPSGGGGAPAPSPAIGGISAPAGQPAIGSMGTGGGFAGGTPSGGMSAVGAAGPIPDAGGAGAFTDPTAQANFAAENTSNPAGSAMLSNTLGNMGNTPTPGTPTGGAGEFTKYLGPAVAGGGLLYSALNQPQMPKGATPEALTGKLLPQADQFAAQGNELTQALSTGKLPAGAQSSIDQAIQSAQAATRSKFAGMGLSGSTMEQQELSHIAESGPQIAFQVASQMAQIGLNETGLADNIYRAIMQQSLQSDQQFSQAIANFAGALGGGGATIKIGQ